MADPSGSVRPNRLYALLSIIGGGLMIGAFFLPEQFGPSLHTAAAPTPAVISMWDVIYILYSGAAAFDPRTNSYVSGQPLVFSAINAGLPLIMGALIVILGIWSILRGASALRAGLVGAAAVLATIKIAGSTLLTLADTSFMYSAIPQYHTLPNLEWQGLGSVVLLLGLFLVIAAGFASALRRAA
jgi:hypothetical protein